MKRIFFVLSVIFFLAVDAVAVVRPGLAETLTARASGTAAIEGGNIAGAQGKAVDAALSRALETVLVRTISPRTFEIMGPLLREKTLSRVQDFVANYKIIGREVTDLTYTVDLAVNVEKDLLIDHLAQLGVIKGAASPMLTVVFVTVDAPLGLEKVKALGTLASRSISSSFTHSGFTVIPVSEREDPGFRLLRPPQTTGVLASRGQAALADLSVGVFFKGAEDGTQGGGGEGSFPMEVSLQAVDARTGDLAGTYRLQESFILETARGSSPPARLEETLGRAARSLALKLKDQYFAPREGIEPTEVIFEGKHDARDVWMVLGEIFSRVGKNTRAVPVRFTPDRSVYNVWAEKGLDGIARALGSSRIVSEIFSVTREGEGLIFREKASGRPPGVSEFSREVPFYRRLPIPGAENPEDVRKIRAVPWQEAENNSDPERANAAPLGEGILGKIDPPGDQDFFLFSLPAGIRRIMIQVEQSGPGEVRPRVRVFGEDGTSLNDQKAGARGGNLSFGFPVPDGTGRIFLCVEDHLGRYPSVFPYVLTVEGGKREGSGEPP